MSSLTFLTPPCLPSRAHGNKYQPYTCLPRMTSAETPSKSTKIPPKPALPPPSFVLETPLAAALYKSFQEAPQSCAKHMNAVLSSEAKWDTALFSVKGRSEILDSLNSFLSFALDPTICIHSVQENNLRWTLSFTYPLPWRPQVTVSGRSEMTLTKSGKEVYEIKDKWDKAPLTLLQQAMPTIADILWLFPIPVPESDAGTRELLKKGRGYEVVRQAPRPEFVVVENVYEKEQQYFWATPAFPENAFEDTLRRLERYWTVTPISIREIGDDLFEWAVAVPGRLVGSSKELILVPEDQTASVIERPERIFGCMRFAGFATKDIVKEKVEVLVQKLRDDGLWGDEEMERERVWGRIYNATAGFSIRGKLTMATYGQTFGVRRVNEIAIDITDRWESSSEK